MQQALYYLNLLENLPEKEILNQLHRLSFLGEKEILEGYYEHGKSMAEDPKFHKKNPDVNWKKIGLTLIGWAADQKHILSILYLLNEQLKESKFQYQQQDDYYKLIRQAEKIKSKLQKILPSSNEEKSEYDQLVEDVDLIIDDRKNFFKDEEKRQKI